MMIDQQLAKGERAFSVHVTEASVAAAMDFPKLPQLPLPPPPDPAQSDDAQVACKSTSTEPGPIFPQAAANFNPKKPEVPKMYAFTVVSQNPARLHLAQKSSLQPSDVGISLLRTLYVDIARRVWVVDSTPLCVQPSLPQTTPDSDAVAASAKVPVLFSPSSIPLDSLMEIHTWSIKEEAGLLISSAVPADSDLSACGNTAKATRAMSDVLTKLQRAGASGYIPTADSDANVQKCEEACLSVLKQLGVVELVKRNKCYCFSQGAQEHLRATRVLHGPTRLMVVRDIPYVDMTLFELLKSLELIGFQCVVSSRGERKRIRQKAYTSGDAEKVWYMEAGVKPSKNHLISLLHADAHKQPVPALADSTKYRKILVEHGLLNALPARKNRLVAIHDAIVGEQDWDLPPPPAPRPQRKRKQKPPEAQAHASVQDDDGGDDAECVVPASPAPSGVPSPGNTSDDDDCEHSDEAGLPPAQSLCDVPVPSGSAPAHSSRSSSSSSSSSSSVSCQSSESSSSSSSSADGRGSATGPKPRKAPVLDRRKDMTRSLAVGPCRLTPRFLKDNTTLTGYQMTCYLQGHGNCNKSLANSVSGSEDQTIQMLKTWVVLGLTSKAASKHPHKALWSDVVKAKHRLPSMAELDAALNGQADLATVAVSSPAAPVSGPSTRIRSKRKQPAAPEEPKTRPSAKKMSKRGDLVPGPVPPDVLAQIEELINSGAIPRTTPEQRARNRRTAGTTYGVPQALSPALQYGFICENGLRTMGNDFVLAAIPHVLCDVWQVKLILGCCGSENVAQCYVDLEP